MKKISLILWLIVILSCSAQNKTIESKQLIEKASFQLKDNFKGANNLFTSKKFPRTTELSGEVKFVGKKDWTSGFYPGVLWLMYDLTDDSSWKDEATMYTDSLETEKFNTSDHDIGFKMMCSFGLGYKLTKNEEYKNVLIQSAQSLATRYAPKVGAIKSWNEKKSLNGKYTWKFPVIIDNMMNLELLFFASNVTNDSRYREIAIQHAETTMINHIRPDYSSYHMINYDEETGIVVDRKTVQGFSDNSQWARGQAWGVYGFTLVYRETKEAKFLDTAQKMANFYLDNERLPKDKIPYWDFYAGEDGYVPEWNFDPKKYDSIPRDASAAAIMASALFELAGYSEQALKEKYITSATAMLASLSSTEYLAKPSTNTHFLLKNSVGHMQRNSEVNVPIIYADYYYLEALKRHKNLPENNKQ